MYLRELRKNPLGCPNQACRATRSCLGVKLDRAGCPTAYEYQYVVREDHDAGDEDRRGSVACTCEPWCGFAVCSCGEDHASSDDGKRCRDCAIQHGLDSMQCSACGRMRYRTDTIARELAEYLWGERCACPDPKPRTLAE